MAQFQFLLRKSQWHWKKRVRTKMVISKIFFTIHACRYFIFKPARLYISCRIIHILSLKTSISFSPEKNFLNIKQCEITNTFFQEKNETFADRQLSQFTFFKLNRLKINIISWYLPLSRVCKNVIYQYRQASVMPFKRCFEVFVYPTLWFDLWNILPSTHISI